MPRGTMTIIMIRTVFTYTTKLEEVALILNEILWVWLQNKHHQFLGLNQQGGTELNYILISLGGV